MQRKSVILAIEIFEKMCSFYICQESHTNKTIKEKFKGHVSDTIDSLFCDKYFYIRHRLSKQLNTIHTEVCNYNFTYLSVCTDKIQYCNIELVQTCFNSRFPAARYSFVTFVNRHICNYYGKLCTVASNSQTSQ